MGAKRSDRRPENGKDFWVGAPPKGGDDAKRRQEMVREWKREKSGKSSREKLRLKRGDAKTREVFGGNRFQNPNRRGSGGGLGAGQARPETGTKAGKKLTLGKVKTAPKVIEKNHPGTGNSLAAELCGRATGWT